MEDRPPARGLSPRRSESPGGGVDGSIEPRHRTLTAPRLHRNRRIRCRLPILRRSSSRTVLGDPVAVAAMVDRLVHYAEVTALKGESYRLKGRGKEVTASSDSGYV